LVVSWKLTVVASEPRFATNRVDAARNLVRLRVDRRVAAAPVTAVPGTVSVAEAPPQEA